MMAFPSMLSQAASDAGMPVPEDPDDDTSWSKDTHPNFFLFCVAQLCRPTTHGEHWENAKVIARIPAAAVPTTTFQDLIDLGVYPEQYG